MIRGHETSGGNRKAAAVRPASVKIGDHFTMFMPNRLFITGIFANIVDRLCAENGE